MNMRIGYAYCAPWLPKPSCQYVQRIAYKGGLVALSFESSRQDHTRPRKSP